MPKPKIQLTFSLAMLLAAMIVGCTSIQNDFGTTDFGSFNMNGTYNGRLQLIDAATSTPTSQARFQLTLSQQGATITGTGSSLGDTVRRGIGVMNDKLSGSIAYYANYFAHINAYFYPSGETLDQAKQDGSAIPMDLVVNTLTNTAEANLFPHGDSTNYVELLATK